MTDEDKASYDSTPPCTYVRVCVCMRMSVNARVYVCARGKLKKADRRV